MIYVVVGKRSNYTETDDHKNFYVCSDKEEAKFIMSLLRERQSRVISAKEYFDNNYRGKQGFLINVSKLQDQFDETALKFDLDVNELDIDGHKQWFFSIEGIPSNGDKVMLYVDPFLANK
jgi:hypothetical protein